jgi:DNA-binding CsgD family transcriptional regulator
MSQALGCTEMDGNPRCRVTRFQIGGEQLVIASYPAPSSSIDRLTPTERRLLQGLLQAQSARDLARERNRSLATVRHQVEGIYQKLGVHSRAELAAFCASQASRSTGGRRPNGQRHHRSRREGVLARGK